MQISRYFTQDTDWWSLHHDLSKPKPTPFMMALASQKPNWCKMASFQMPTKAHLNGKQNYLIVHNLKYFEIAWQLVCMERLHWFCVLNKTRGIQHWGCEWCLWRAGMLINLKFAAWHKIAFSKHFFGTCKSTLEHQAATIINYSNLWWNLMPVQSLMSFNWDKV